MSAQHQSVEEQERSLAAKGRMVSIVIVVTMLLWMFVQFYLAAKLQLEVRYQLLIDLFAMAALLWSFIVSWQIKRARKTVRDEN